MYAKYVATEQPSHDHFLQGIGMGLLALTTTARIWNDTDEQIYDRSYRLHYNKGQTWMDKFTYGSALAGGLVGMAAMPSWSVTGGIQGASVGIGLAVFAHAMTCHKEKKDCCLLPLTFEDY